MKKRIFELVVLLFCVGLFVVGCNGGEEEAEHTAVHWTYEGEEGPEHWGDLSQDYALCSTGREQSPINLTNAEASDLQDIIFEYKSSAVKILNNGHTVQVNYDTGSFIAINGTRYQLIQFHFHVPSEHSVEGELKAMEMHLVHKADDESLAVVGVMINIGAENEAFASVWDNLPAEESPETTIAGATVDAASLLPDTLTYYTYPGSLTTPPCSEKVTWLVLTTPIEMSAEQIEAFEAIVELNNRPVQPLNERDLQEDTTTGN